MEKLKWHNEKRKIKDLIPFKENPRKISDEQINDLKKSLEKFNLVEIPAININNKIISGHQRLKIMKLLDRGDEEVDVRVPNRELTEEEFKEYNLRSNKNTAEWDYKLLAAFDEEILLESGFEEDELMVNIGLSNVDEVLLDEDRMEVISVDAPESPRLKIKESFYCKDIRDFNLIKKFFNSRNGRLDIKKLLDLIK